MSTASLNGLLIISVIAVIAPVLAASVKRLKLPSAIVEIVAGIIVGPSVLAWVKINQPVNAVALLGLAFLLFLAGLEIDLRATTPRHTGRPARHRLAPRTGHPRPGICRHNRHLAGFSRSARTVAAVTENPDLYGLRSS